MINMYVMLLENEISIRKFMYYSELEQMNISQEAILLGLEN